MSEADIPPRFFPPWLEAGTVTALLVPLFYTAGWSYAYHYFERFNLGLIGLDIPKEHFFLFSYWTVKDQIWLFLLVLGGYLAVYGSGRIGFQRLMVWGRGRKMEPVLRGVPAFFVPIMIFSLFWIFYGLGEKAAGNAFEWQAANDFKSYQRVKVWAKGPGAGGTGKGGAKWAGDFGKAMKKEWESGCWRLLMRNKDHLFLFYPGQAEDRMPTDVIPAGRVEMVRVLGENVSCGGNK